MKKVLLLALSILLLSCITLYAAGDAEEEEVGMKVGLVTDVGKVDDKTFNQFAYEGMMRAAEEFDLKADYIETLQPTDYEKNIQTFAEEGYDIIVTVGFMLTDATLMMAEKYPVKIPNGLSAGPLKIMIGDGVSFTKADAEAEEGEFVPQSVAQLVKAINNLKKNDRLYIRLYRDRQGAVIEGQGLPALPPSLLALYNSRKTSGETQPIKRVVYVEHELPATDYVLTGQKVIEVKIEG